MSERQATMVLLKFIRSLKDHARDRCKKRFHGVEMHARMHGRNSDGFVQRVTILVPRAAILLASATDRDL